MELDYLAWGTIRNRDDLLQLMRGRQIELVYVDDLMKIAAPKAYDLLLASIGSDFELVFSTEDRTPARVDYITQHGVENTMGQNRFAWQHLVLRSREQSQR